MLKKISYIAITAGIIFAVLGYMSFKGIMISKDYTFTIGTISFICCIFGSVLSLINDIKVSKRSKQ